MIIDLIIISWDLNSQCLKIYLPNQFEQNSLVNKIYIYKIKHIGGYNSKPSTLIIEKLEKAYTTWEFIYQMTVDYLVRVVGQDELKWRTASQADKTWFDPLDNENYY